MQQRVEEALECPVDSSRQSRLQQQKATEAATEAVTPTTKATPTTVVLEGTIYSS
jgi:hypothetical protein